MEQEIHEGLPTLSLFPLNNAQFKVVNNLSITLPRSGSYNELQPDIFAKDSGDFKILDNDVLYLPSITKVLLAIDKYPKLERNQVFTPLSFKFEKDQVVINGSTLEIISIEER